MRFCLARLYKSIIITENIISLYAYNKTNIKKCIGLLYIQVLENKLTVSIALTLWTHGAENVAWCPFQVEEKHNIERLGY